MTTVLPDGSAFSTATILSRREAMKLPPKERPLNYRISSKLYHAVFESVGEASMQWQPRPGSEVFDSEGASRVAVNLCFKIADEMDVKNAQIRRLKITCVLLAVAAVVALAILA